MEPSKFQEAVLSVPDDCDLFLGGGRGGGKSFGLAFVVLKHVAQYGAKARALYFRQSYSGVTDFEAICRELFAIADPGAKYNQQSHIWKFQNGASVEIGQLQNFGDYAKYQGRSFSLIVADELGQYAEPTLVDLMRSNLRGPIGIPCRCVWAGNPGSVGHQWIAQRFVFKAEPWHPFTDEISKQQVIYCPSIYTDNVGIAHEDYRRQLEAACAGDQELLKAWLTGDWTVARGAYFAGVLDENRNAVMPWTELPEMPSRIMDLSLFERNQLAKQRSSMKWTYFLAHDFGVSAPSITYLVAESPGDEVGTQFYPRGSLVLVDELATVERGSTTKGLGWTVPELSEAIKRFSKKWDVEPRGCADDAIFSRTGSGAGSIAEEFGKHGVHFQPARKADRWSGWELMRLRLQAAGSVDQPGLYISRDCEYFWATVPYLARDPRKLDDVDTTGPDHAADAVRYAAVYRSKTYGPSTMPIKFLR